MPVPRLAHITLASSTTRIQHPPRPLFAAPQGFDFNKMIRDGVGYLPLSYRDAKAAGLAEQADNQARSSELKVRVCACVWARVCGGRFGGGGAINARRGRGLGADWIAWVLHGCFGCREGAGGGCGRGRGMQAGQLGVCWCGFMQARGWGVRSSRSLPTRTRPPPPVHRLCRRPAFLASCLMWDLLSY